jgi:cytochrome P450
MSDGGHIMATASVFEQILDYSSRADPYRLYGELREVPVSRQEDGSYVVSTYREIVELLHDPRVSSDARSLSHLPATQPAPREKSNGLPPPFIDLDPPDHDQLRRRVMYHFGPPHSPGKVDGMRPEMAEIIAGLVDGIADRKQADIVEDIAHPFPVIVICRLLGVPREDESRFRTWADAIAETFGPGQGDPAERQRTRGSAMAALGQYLGELAEARRGKPGDDLISGLVSSDGPDGPMSPGDVVSTAVLLLIAGHETTVNLITNGVLTLLRHPEVLQRLKREPELVIRTVEELLRYEPPVHFPVLRAALDDITIAGTTIPKGAPIVLALAAGSRDPGCIRDPERFDPDREANQHLGFGGGIHYCFGAPLARLETQLALTEVFSRLENPRLLADPPPYRTGSALRGPRHLQIEFDRVMPRTQK